jgi:hypothetical protein
MADRSHGILSASGDEADKIAAGAKAPTPSSPTKKRAESSMFETVEH